MQYIIYESAMTPEISNIKKLAGVVEFTTVLQEADAKNRNGRIYPKAVIDAAIHAPLVNEKMRTHTWFGECGHPFSTEISRQTNVVMTNAAFRIDEVWWEGNLLKGRCQTLNTALGRDMAGLIEQGSQLSFSMRGQGNVARDPARDALVVQSPLALITFDWVWIPSHDVAYMDKISEETHNTMFNYNSYSNKQMALTESLNLYENGAMIEMEKDIIKEKPMKDYYVNYNKSFKTLAETYVFDANDKVKEMTDKYVILESTDCLKKVARNDYLLKSIRSGISEDCAGIAPLDCRYGDVTRPLMPGDEHPAGGEEGISTEKVLQTVASSEDVKPEYENPVEHAVKAKLGDDPKDVSASLTEDEDEKKKDFEIESDDDECDNEEGCDKEDSDDEDEKSETDDDEEESDEDDDDAKKELKEEFFKYYNIIAEETGLTEEADIIAQGAKYSEYMTEKCAFLFNSLNESNKASKKIGKLAGKYIAASRKAESDGDVEASNKFAEKASTYMYAGRAAASVDYDENTPDDIINKPDTGAHKHKPNEWWADQNSRVQRGTARTTQAAVNKGFITQSETDED